MDNDFHIEVLAPTGLGVLRPFLAQFPFEVAFEENGPSGAATLVQGAVSEFAGFHPSGSKGDRYFFDASVRSSSLGDPEDVMRLLSAALSHAGLAHWIWRMEFELDDDTLVVDCGMGNHPTSSRS